MKSGWMKPRSDETKFDEKDCRVGAGAGVVVMLVVVVLALVLLMCGCQVGGVDSFVDDDDDDWAPPADELGSR